MKSKKAKTSEKYQPTKQTLDKYGLSLDEWNSIADSQDGVCFICRNSSKLATDHEHVKGWKKMPPEERKTYVRGLLCWYCNNKYLGRGMSIEKSVRVTEYLTNYKHRRYPNGT